MCFRLPHGQVVALVGFHMMVSGLYKHPELLLRDKYSNGAHGSLRSAANTGTNVCESSHRKREDPLPESQA